MAFHFALPLRHRADKQQLAVYVQLHANRFVRPELSGDSDSTDSLYFLNGKSVANYFGKMPTIPGISNTLNIARKSSCTIARSVLENEPPLKKYLMTKITSKPYSLHLHKPGVPIFSEHLAYLFYSPYFSLGATR